VTAETLVAGETRKIIAVTTRLPETTLRRGATLPAPALALEAYWHLMRHRWVYAGQLVALAAATWLAYAVADIVMALATQSADPTWRITISQLTYVATSVVMLVLGGTALFAVSQRAILLGERPSVGDGLRLGRDRVLLRAVTHYWLVVHLVPTVSAHVIYLGPALGLTWVPSLPVPLIYLLYWVWVFATAPLVVLGLPITLLEGGAAPFAEGRRRLDGNRWRFSAAAMLAFAPLAIIRIALVLLNHNWMPDDPVVAWILDVTLFSIGEMIVSFASILVMASVVAVVYARLSPRFDRLYRVFD
jgi:hypothetical protein